SSLTVVNWSKGNITEKEKPEYAHNQSLFWGTYRPNIYFGTRTRNENTILTGLAWVGVNAPENLHS
ncbi:hypothetical protein HK096_007179, partial [Nowakowskiella sp. JEL0078]